jgi:hypothetical protein
MLVSARSENNYRVRSYGFSPNRVATLGANLLVFINLTGILITCFSSHFGAIRSAPGEVLARAVVAGVCRLGDRRRFAFPYLFRFK